LRPVRALGSIGVLALLLVAAGCGGGGGGKSSGGDWVVLDKGTFSGNDPAFLHTTIGRPSQLEVTVEASPSVQSKTHYTIGCGNEAVFRHGGPRGTTPFTGPVAVPPGAPGSCFIQLSATKSKPTKLTVTLLTRSVPGT
jgi:hypothetical protein